METHDEFYIAVTDDKGKTVERLGVIGKYSVNALQRLTDKLGMKIEQVGADLLPAPHFLRLKLATTTLIVMVDSNGNATLVLETPSGCLEIPVAHTAATLDPDALVKEFGEDWRYHMMLNYISKFGTDTFLQRFGKKE